LLATFAGDSVRDTLNRLERRYLCEQVGKLCVLTPWSNIVALAVHPMLVIQFEVVGKRGYDTCLALIAAGNTRLCRVSSAGEILYRGNSKKAIGNPGR
jgi:hypothetical protein